MPRNDRSDSLSVRGDDDPRNPMKAMEQESEMELLQVERDHRGGPAHATQEDRDGLPSDRRGDEEAEYARAVRRATDEQQREPDLQVPRGSPSTGGGGNATRGPVSDE